MTTIRAAFYARVSGEQQAAAHTIESQVAALSERAHSDGTPVPPERQFVDDGYSGATLIRPALDRLRDLVSVGTYGKTHMMPRGKNSRLRAARGRPRNRGEAMRQSQPIRRSGSM
jgi:site-specific DNA recombinase